MRRKDTRREGEGERRRRRKKEGGKKEAEKRMVREEGQSDRQAEVQNDSQKERKTVEQKIWKR